MSLHVKKINRQFSVLKKPELSGFFHAPSAVAVDVIKEVEGESQVM